MLPFRQLLAALRWSLMSKTTLSCDVGTQAAATASDTGWLCLAELFWRQPCRCWGMLKAAVVKTHIAVLRFLLGGSFWNT